MFGAKKQSKDSDNFFLGFLIVVILFAVVLDWLTSSISRKELLDMYNLRNSLMKVLPEGQKFYDTGYMMAYNAYKASQRKLSTEEKANIIVDLVKNGGKNIKISLDAKMQAFFAKYIFAFGVFYAVVHKSFWFIVFSLVLVLMLFIYRNRKSIEELFVLLKAKYFYNPFKDKDIDRVLSILLANPVPASILHHKPEKFGLFEHSYSVAKKVVNELIKQKAPEEKQKEGFLAGLLHDIGKIRLYRYECKEPFYVPSPLDDEKKKQNKKKKICKWTSAGLNQEVVNRSTMTLLAEKYGIRIPKDKDIWELVKQKDMEATLEELKSADYPLDRFFEETIRKLNINDVFGTGKYDGWHRSDFPYVVVLAHAFNRNLVRTIKDKEPAIPLSEEPDRKGVHTIAYIIPKKLSKCIEFNPGSDLGVWDVKVGEKTFKSVYFLKKDCIPEDLIQRWGDVSYEIKEIRDN